MFKSKHSKILSISAICNLNLAGDIHTSANDLIFFFFKAASSCKQHTYTKDMW